MLPDRVSNPGPLTYESGALPIALRGPAHLGKQWKSQSIYGHENKSLEITDCVSLYLVPLVSRSGWGDHGYPARGCYYYYFFFFFTRKNILFYRFLQLSPICVFVQHNVCQK